MGRTHGEFASMMKERVCTENEKEISKQFKIYIIIEKHHRYLENRMSLDNLLQAVVLREIRSSAAFVSVLFYCHIILLPGTAG